MFYHNNETFKNRGLNFENIFSIYGITIFDEIRFSQSCIERWNKSRMSLSL
jgi:hypothetical protein